VLCTAYLATATVSAGTAASMALPLSSRETEHSSWPSLGQEHMSHWQHWSLHSCCWFCCCCCCSLLRLLQPASVRVHGYTSCRMLQCTTQPQSSLQTQSGTYAAYRARRPSMVRGLAVAHQCCFCLCGAAV
jgi:hypothetical protein